MYKLYCNASEQKALIKIFKAAKFKFACNCTHDVLGFYIIYKDRNLYLPYIHNFQSDSEVATSSKYKAVNIMQFLRILIKNKNSCPYKIT